jgi:hypothetical protein
VVAGDSPQHAPGEIAHRPKGPSIARAAHYAGILRERVSRRIRAQLVEMLLADL